MVYRPGSASQQIEYFAQQSTDASGQVVLALTQTPVSNKVQVIATRAGRPVHAHVLSVSGKSITVEALDATTPSLTHASQTHVAAGSGAVSSSANVWLGSQAASATCIATCNQNHPGTAGPTNGPLAPTVAFGQSWTDATVAATTAHAATAFPLLASQSGIDFAIIYSAS